MADEELDGFDYDDVPEPPKTPVVKSKSVEVAPPKSAGKGRKTCPNCKNVVGVRTKVCPHTLSNGLACNYEFEIGSSKAPGAPQPKPEKMEESLDTEEAAQTNSGRNLRIDAPHGHCPHKLAGLDEKSVFDWTEKVRMTGVNNARWYTKKALKYWVREFYDIHGSDHEAACEMIEMVCCE